jgi:hypothetical protein
MVLFGASDGIWNVIAAGARNSPVPRTLGWRVAVITVGLAAVAVGVTYLFSALV